MSGFISFLEVSGMAAKNVLSDHINCNHPHLGHAVFGNLENHMTDIL